MTDEVAGPLVIDTVARLSAADQRELAALVAAVASADGVSPVDDQVRTEIAYGAGPAGAHLLARLGEDSPAIAGYAHATTDAEGVSAHLVVALGRRRRGVGTALLQRLFAAALGPGSTVRIWAHGDTAGARGFAEARGLSRVRDLYLMRRSMAAALPEASYPAEVTVRTFEVGRDEEAWLDLNRRAFADHPEQGRLTLDDLRHREAEAWFDPAGFFLAERDGRPVGSHWTKTHPAGDAGPDAVGEVYAVGVAPDAQGLGLGKALTLTGLHHLRDKGLGEVILYVDGDNTAAVSLYRRLGFEIANVDVMYAVPVPSSSTS